MLLGPLRAHGLYRPRHDRLCWVSRGGPSPMPGGRVSHREVRDLFGFQTPSAKPRFRLNQQSHDILYLRGERSRPCHGRRRATHHVTIDRPCCENRAWWASHAVPPRGSPPMHRAALGAGHVAVFPSRSDGQSRINHAHIAVSCRVPLPYLR